MKVLRFADHTQLSRYAADLVIDQLRAKHDTVLGLATGATPIDLYARLIDSYNADEVSFKDVTVFNLDEYLGLEEGHPESYKQFMKDKLFSGIDINLEKTFIPSAHPADADQEGRDYEKKIRESGGIDLQILGLGTNGHIGFNEPEAELHRDAHHVQLTDKTRQDNSRYFESLDQVPTAAITMGVGTIMSSRLIVLMASGPAKAEAIQKTIEGNITTQVPASLLQLHPNVVVLIDEAAAALLKESSYEII